ncbi:MAG: glycosyltransferase, partial [Pseudomonadota bacterium]
MQHALSYYRLTAAFRETVEQALGPVTDWVFMGDLRNRGLRGMMSSLRAVRGETLLVCIENDNGRPLATPLALAAFASRCRKIKIVWPDGRVEAVSRWRLFPMIWKLMAAQVQSRRAFRRVQRLAARPVQPASEFRTQRDAAGGLFVDANLSFGVTAGGSVGHIQGVLNGFVRQGHPMDYASIKAPPPGATDVGWKTLPTPGMLAFPAELNYYTHHAVADRSLRRSAEAKAYRFVYQRLSLHNLSGTVLADRFGLPLVVEYNGSEAWAAEKWGTRLSLHDAAVATEHATMRRADLVVTISAPLRDEALALGVPADRIVTYPNCVDLALFAPSRFSEDAREALRDRLGIAQNARVGTFIGTFGAWHGIEFLAAGIRRLIDEDRAYVDAN